MALEGDLKFFRLPDILQVISGQQKTGILTVQGEQDILAVSFLRGDIVAADALNQNFERGLGEVLASQGILRPEQFAKLFEEQKNSGKRLADFLVDSGLLERALLLEALRQLTYHLLLQVLRWRSGEFKFYSGDEVSFEEGFVALPVAEVLMRSLGDLMGEGTLSGALPHSFVTYERTTSARPIRVIGRDGTPPAEPGEELWVSSDEQVLLERLDGTRPADLIAKTSGLGEHRTLYGLFRLLQAGLVRPAGSLPEATTVGEPAREPAPPPVRRRETKPRLIEVPKESLAAEREAWTSRLLAAGSAAGVVVLALVVGLSAAALLLPFPWLHGERAAFLRQQKLARTLVIDRAARTYFLLEGRYPDRLGELAEIGLLNPRQLRSPDGEPFGFEADTISYVLASRGRGRGTDSRISETVSGDFVVDPEYFVELRDDEGTPLILLD